MPARACDPTLKDSAPIYESAVPLSGKESVARRLLLPSDHEVLLIAAEAGIDIKLAIDGDGSSIAIADTPVSRSGIQRIVLRPRKGISYVAKLSAKDSQAPVGTVKLRAVVLTPQARDHRCEATHRHLAKGDSLYARGQATRSGEISPGDAVADFRASAQAYEKAAESVGESSFALSAEAMHSVAASLYSGVRDWTGAESWSRQAAERYAQAHHTSGVARAETLRAAALLEMPRTVTQQNPGAASKPSNLELAVSLLDRASTQHARLGDRFEEAQARNFLGIAHHLSDQFSAATESYEVALSLYRRLGETTKQVQVMGNLAVVEYELGELDRANELYAELRGLINPKESPELFVNVLNNSALSLRTSGQSDKALELYETALAAARRMQDAYYEAVSLQGIGTAYEELGDLDLALQYYQQALALRTPALDARLRVETLWSIANVRRLQGDYPTALRLDREALGLAANPLARSRMRLQIAHDHMALGQPADARMILQQLFMERGAGDELILADARMLRAQLPAAKTGGTDPVADLNAALEIFRKYEASRDEFNALVALAHIQRRRNDKAAAMKTVDAAIELAESLRLQSTNPELRATMLHSLRPAFDLKISLLGERHATASSDERRRIAQQALATADRGRGRSLEDYERIDFAVASAPSHLLDRRRSTYSALARYRLRLEMEVRFARADADLLDALRRNIADAKQQLDRIDAELGRTSASMATNRQIRVDTIPASVAIVEYWIGTQNSYAWVVTRDSLTMLPIGSSSDISRAALSAQRALKDQGSTLAERAQLLRQLSARIWDPLESLPGGKRTLVFVPDMELHYVPFSALIKPGGQRRFLVEDFDVTIAPSVRLLTNPRPRASHTPARMLLVDDPVYDREDPRWQSALRAKASTTGRGSRRLVGTSREAAAIIALVPTESIDRLRGFDASRDRLLAASLDEYRYIHIASHAVADMQIPLLSALLLSAYDAKGNRIDDRVLAADLLNTRLSADLVTLSACETAGSSVVSTEGLVGMRYVLLARGARSVASSLWKAPDRVAADIMSRFYEGMLQRRAPASRAVSDALRISMKEFDGDPALWAAFDLTIRDIGVLQETDSG